MEKILLLSFLFLLLQGTSAMLQDAEPHTLAVNVAGNQHSPTDILAILLPLIDQCDKKRGGLAWAPVALANQHSWSMKVKKALGQDYGNSTVQSGHNSQGIWLTVLIAGGRAGGHDCKWIQQEAVFQMPIKY